MTIRAIDGVAPPPQQSGWLGLIAAIIDAVLRLFTGNILGEVAPRKVSFDASGRSPLTTFTLVGQWLTPDGFVSKRYTIWKWQYRSNGAWIDFDTSLHTIYVVLGVPNTPWVQSGDASQLPWADALDQACAWGADAKTLEEAAERITRASTGSTMSPTPR